jgi:hypothetical protein
MRSRNRRRALEQSHSSSDLKGPVDSAKKKVPQVSAFVASRIRQDRASTAPPLREGDSRATTGLLGDPPGPNDSRRRRSPRNRD